jgi:hypothetical protein
MAKEGGMNELSLITKLAGAICGIALLMIVPARAQPIIVQGHYEETMGPGSCNNVSSTQCYHLFTAVPSNETLIVTTINCGIFTYKKAAQIESVILGVNMPQQSPLLYVPVTLVGTNTFNGTVTTMYSALATPISKIYTAGQIPSILITQVAVDNPWFLCTIEGTMTP